MALNGRVLLLNQTYEPLGTVSVARAIIMTFKNTVFVEEFTPFIASNPHFEVGKASRYENSQSEFRNPKFFLWRSQVGKAPHC